jgi:hypothetical protein
LEDKGAVYTLRVDNGGGGGQRQEMWAHQVFLGVWKACAMLAAGWWPLEDKGAIYMLRVDNDGGGRQVQRA